MCTFSHPAKNHRGWMVGLDPWMDWDVRARSNAKPGWVKSVLLVCLSCFCSQCHAHCTALWSWSWEISNKDQGWVSQLSQSLVCMMTVSIQGAFSRIDRDVIYLPGWLCFSLGNRFLIHSFLWVSRQAFVLLFVFHCNQKGHRGTNHLSPMKWWTETIQSRLCS